MKTKKAQILGDLSLDRDCQQTTQKRRGRDSPPVPLAEVLLLLSEERIRCVTDESKTVRDETLDFQFNTPDRSSILNSMHQWCTNYAPAS